MSLSKPEVGTAVVEITGTGRGRIVNESTRGLWKKFDTIASDKLKGHAPGTLLNVTIRLSPTGRKMIQWVKVKQTENEEALRIDREWNERKGKKPTTTAEQVLTGLGVTFGAPSPAPAPSPSAVTPPTTGTVVSNKAVYTVDNEKIKKLFEETNMAQPKTPKSELDGYYISPEVRMTLSTAKRLMDKRPERAVKVMMVGGSGMGKTTMPRLLAQRLGMGFMRMDCGKIRDSEEWFGYREAQAGTTVFIRSRFAKALEEGNIVIVLDEFNRLEPWLHNTLFPLLDEEGRTVVHDEEFTIGRNVLIVGTINDGAEYTGTFQLDKALMNRFELVVEVGAIPHGEEVRVLMNRTGISNTDAARIVKMANLLRQMQIPCPIRSTLNIAAFVTTGLSIRQAFETAVVLRLPPDVHGSNARKNVIDILNTDLGTFNTMTPWDVFKEEEPVVESIEVEKPKEKRVVNYMLSLHNMGKPIGTIALIAALRSLPLLTEDNEIRQMTQREAQEYVRLIEANQAVVLELACKPSHLDKLIETFNSCGVSGFYSSRKDGVMSNG